MQERSAVWSRREVLAALALAACGPGESAPVPKVPIAPPRNLLVVQAYGGWDTTYSIDPKPDSPWMDIPEGRLERLGELPLWTDKSRPLTRRFFERHHERVAIVHGINVRSVDHTQCLRWMLTGTRDPVAPDLCAILASTHGAELPIPYLLLSDKAFLGPLASIAARAGGMNQVAALADPRQGYPPLDGTLPLQPTDAEAMAIARWRQQRPRLPGLGEVVGQRQDLPKARERAAALRGVSDWLGRASVPQALPGQIATALSLLEGGLTRAVMLDSRSYFDTHGRNEEQLFSQEETFEALDLLFTELERRKGRQGGSLFDETVVAVLSEMGRSQVLNEHGGKDHWPFASVLLAGAGIAGDVVHGATDDDFFGVRIDLATGAPDPAGEDLVAERLTAGLLGAVGVDPSPWLGDILPFHGFYRV